MFDKNKAISDLLDTNANQAQVVRSSQKIC